MVGIDDPVMFDPQSDVGPSNILQQDAIRNAFKWSLGALAAGAGARGLTGIGSFFNRNLSEGPKTPLRQSYVRIPVPVKVRTAKERDALLEAADTENDQDAGFAKLATDLLKQTSNLFGDTFGLYRRPGEIAGALRDAYSGWNEPSMFQKAWAYPAVGAGIAGGLYGGWKLTDYLLDKTKNMEQESELEQARKEYESALAGRRKLASAEVTPSSLDVLADRYEKRALWNQSKGLTMLGLGGIGLGSGIAAYNWARSISEDKAIEEAVQRRQAQIAEQAPSPVMAIPTPVPIYEPGNSQLDQLMGRGQRLIGRGRRLLGHAPPKREKEKTANVGQAADQFLNRIKSNQMAVWQRLMTPVDGKAAKPAKPAEPLPPQLPTLAGTRSRMAGQQSV